MSVSKLSEQMLAAGYEVEVFTTTANGTVELPVVPNKKTEIDGVSITYFKRITKDHSHFSPSLLRCLWRDVRKFDVVHVHAWWNLVSVLSCLIAVMRKVPVAVSPRGTLSAYSFTNSNNFSKKVLHQLLGKHLLTRSYIHVTSAREKAGIESIIQPKKLSLYPILWYWAIPLQSKSNRPADAWNCFFFPDLKKRKGWIFCLMP